METRDTILRLIEQTALILRAFFNSLPLEEESHEQQMENFTSSLKGQTAVDLDLLLTLETPLQVQHFFASHPSFDATNQELLADLLVTLTEQTSSISTSLMYKKTALILYLVINQTTQTHDWNRQEKINKLRLN
ncbi:hypothetical protein [Myroides odoratus]|uniref:hypothetical protein n=1 Tax=Myroides odoratus TaxID=256 RepID=UPI0007660FAF|nr:hypothetical protein [Myroides odoratus]